MTQEGEPTEGLPAGNSEIGTEKVPLTLKQTVIGILDVRTAELEIEYKNEEVLANGSLIKIAGIKGTIRELQGIKALVELLPDDSNGSPNYEIEVKREVDAYLNNQQVANTDTTKKVLDAVEGETKNA